MSVRKRVAHFLLVPELAHSPPNDALVRAWLDLGYDVDLFAPGGNFSVERYGPRVRAFPAEYGYRWLLHNVWRLRWRQYACFSGTTEDPMAAAGLLGLLHRRPVVTLADEIKSGMSSGERSARWKQLCRFGMRRAALTIVNEQQRIRLQREYAGLAQSCPIVVYPGCFASTPEPGDRAKIRAQARIPPDALVLCFSGFLSHGNGGVWLADVVARQTQVWVWAQIVNLDPLTRGLLERLEGHERLRLQNERMTWQEAWASMSAVDIGLVVYLQEGPQFQHMGTASNRLCMFLAMGVPVIARRQPSFEFVEQYDCGVLVEDSTDIGNAVTYIAQRLSVMRENALLCAAQYIRSSERWLDLRAALQEVM